MTASNHPAAGELTSPNDVCPRCGAVFHCGVKSPAPCACGSVRLTPDLLLVLRTRYAHCLCLDCLRQVAAGAPLSLGEAGITS